jgi:hypothetical protein
MKYVVNVSNQPKPLQAIVGNQYQPTVYANANEQALPDADWGNGQPGQSYPSTPYRPASRPVFVNANEAPLLEPNWNETPGPQFASNGSGQGKASPCETALPDAKWD